MKKHNGDGPFYSSKVEVKRAFEQRAKRSSKQRGYTLAFTDQDFLLREELRPIRLQLELLRPELVLRDFEIDHALVFFGSSKIPAPEVAELQLSEAKAALDKSPSDEACQQALHRAELIFENSQYLSEATRLAYLASSHEESDLVVVTGGGPSFMEAANRGAADANKHSIALNMILPHEQVPNEYVTPELTFQFHYFAIRKMHFLMRARALAAFPGGFGTMDELFEVLTLMQTQKIERIPILLFNKRFWDRVVNFEGFVAEGTIREEDLSLIRYVETADEAWKIISDYYSAG
jgi:uncharacterized protein (TIGR00730 family)